MSEQIEFLVESVKEIKIDVKEFIKSQANQDTRLALIEKDTEHTYNKISKHIDNHWKWIGIFAIILGIIGTIAGYWK